MKILLYFAAAVLPLFPTRGAEKPNMVVFIADDHGYADNSIYGLSNIRTPKMASLAAEGMVFTEAFVASPSCAPSRGALLTGLMPARNGAEANHSLPRPAAMTMVKRLQEQGYEVVALGKIGHGKETEMAGFDFHKDYGGKAGPLVEVVRNFLENRHSDKPLCLMVGDHRPHVPWIRKATYDPAKVTLPGKTLDTPETRQHWARYLTDVTGMDTAMGKVDDLARKHFGKNTYLFAYTSDHGPQWPFGKWNLYDSGIRTPLIIRWTGHVKPASRTAAMVSWVDIMPTLLDLAGAPAPADIDGKSFKDVLLGTSDHHRDEIFTTHSGDGGMNVYPIRSVRTRDFKYIRNLHPEFYHSNHSDILRKDGAGGYWDSWDELAKSSPAAAALEVKYYVRPAEEFYDLQADPGELHNLAGDPASKARMDKMSADLDAWMKSQGDEKTVFNKPYPTSGPRPHEAFMVRGAAGTGPMDD